MGAGEQCVQYLSYMAKGLSACLCTYEERARERERERERQRARAREVEGQRDTGRERESEREREKERERWGEKVANAAEVSCLQLRVSQACGSTPTYRKPKLPTSQNLNPK